MCLRVRTAAIRSRSLLQGLGIFRDYKNSKYKNKANFKQYILFVNDKKTCQHLFFCLYVNLKRALLPVQAKRSGGGGEIFLPRF